MSGREAILARVRAAARQRTEDDAEREDRVAGRIIRHESGLVPRQGASSGHGRLTQFLNKLDQASATVGRISSLAELPRVIARELRKRGLPAEVRMGAEPMFRSLDWSVLKASIGPGRPVEPVTLSRAEFGMAETGTLVLCSVPDLEAAVDEAWRVLRPGGELRIFEHVRSESEWKARIQGWLNPAWGYVADGCRLDRDTDGAFLRRGFEVVEEQRPSIPAEPLPLVILKARKPD